MEALEDVVRSLFTTGQDMDVPAFCLREGPARVVATVADLVARRADDWQTAVVFIGVCGEVPEVMEAIASSAALRAAFALLLASPETRTRLVAIEQLGSLPVHGLRAEAAEMFHRERDLVALCRVIEAGSPMVEELMADEDWLVRWSLASATSTVHFGPEVDALRKRLAADPHPLVAGQAKRQLANIAEREASLAGVTGWTFYSLGDEEDGIPYFGTLANAFIASWPADKTSYTLDELRAFVLAATSGGRPNVAS